MGREPLNTGYSEKAGSEDLTFTHTQGANFELTGKTSGGLPQGDASGGQSLLLLAIQNLKAAVSGLWLKNDRNCKTLKHKKITYST